MKKGQRLLLASDRTQSMRAVSRYGRLGEQIETMSVGGHGWYDTIVVVRVERVIDPDKVYRAFVKKRDSKTPERAAQSSCEAGSAARARAAIATPSNVGRAGGHVRGT